MSVFVTSTVSMFGIALAIDYSLFILMRFREELRAGRDPQQAADAAMATSGLAVVLSGLTVIASVTGIYLINTPVLVSMATGAILAVAVAVLTSTTLTPAVLATFGEAAAKRSCAAALVAAARDHAVAVLDPVDRLGDAPAVAVGVGGDGASARPGRSRVLDGAGQQHAAPVRSDARDPRRRERRGGGARPRRARPGPGAGDVPRRRRRLRAGEGAAPSRRCNSECRRRPTSSRCSPPVFGDDYRSALVVGGAVGGPRGHGRPRDRRLDARTSCRRCPADNATIDVGGPTALIKDFDDRVAKTQPLVFGFVALIAFVMLLISIRSVFLAFKGVLMTVLSVAAAYGSLVVVFQWGWLEDLGFRPISSLDSTIPPLVLAMTFGLSMDYEIFLLTRIRERFLQTNNTRDAVAYGVSTSARTITSAALIMIAVFIGFAFAGMPLVAELGVACAVAIAVDATVVRLVLVPALMAMFDEWNWWLPRWLDRILPSVDFEKPLPKVDIGDLVIIPDDISALAASGIDIRMVVKSAAKLKTMAPAHDQRRRPAGLQRLPAVRSGSDRASTPSTATTNGPLHTVNGARTAPRQDACRRHGRGSAGPSTPSRCGAAGCRWRWTRWRPRPTPTSRPSSAAARWRPPTSSCRPATGCRSRPARRRCG